jgi:hypothetical protein
MADLNWSEYKTTFCEPTNCMLNYIISKGYWLDGHQIKHFGYNQFKNYSSMDMEEMYIGLKEISPESNQICYMSEIRFNKINLELESAFTQSEFDNVLSRFLLIKTEHGSVVMKRGIFLIKNRSSFAITIEIPGNCLQQYVFNPHKGYIHCKLELVKIKNYYNDEFISVQQKKIEEPKEPEKPVLTKIEELDEISELKLLIYGMFDEISELKEHNKSLSERIFLLENKPPIIL